VTKVAKAGNYDWDRLIWILYDHSYRVLEAWEWKRDAYQRTFGAVERLSPADMRSGRCLTGK